MTAVAHDAPDGTRVPTGFRWELALLLILASLQLLPLLAFEFFPTEDGPAHVATAAVSLHYEDPGAVEIREFYRLERFPVPYLASHWILQVAIPILGPEGAVRVLAAICLVGLPLSAWYAFSALGDRSGLLALLAVPLAAGWTLHMGFFNFLLGNVLAMWAVGYWLRRRPLSGSQLVIWGAIVLGAYTAHALGVIVAVGACIWLTLWVDRPRTDPHQGPGREIGGLLLAALPALFLLALHSLREATGSWGRIGFSQTLMRFSSLDRIMVSLSPAEKVVGVILALTLVALGLWSLYAVSTRRAGRLEVGLLMGVAGLGLLYVSGLNRLGNATALSPRLGLYLALGVLLMASATTIPRSSRPLVAGIAVVSVIVLVALRWPVYSDFNRDLREYQSATTVVAENSTVVPVFLIGQRFGTGVSGERAPVRPLLDAAGTLTWDSQVVNLSHLGAGFPHFPVRFVHPDLPLGSLDNTLRKVDGTADYVLVWGARYADPGDLAEPDTAAMLRELDRNYRLVFTSEGRQLLQVYERR